MSEEGLAKYYWFTQFLGWTMYALMLNGYNFFINELSLEATVTLFALVIALGVALSHLYRYVILKGGWLELHISRTILRMMLGSILFGTTYSLAFAVCANVLTPEVDPLLTPRLAGSLTIFFSWTVVFLIWSLLYLVTHYLRNYEREEVKNLRLQSSQNEVELASLKAQLNPHFIFNAMNSIRALIEEDPALAKTALTKLSNILRKSLLSDKRNLITLSEEFDLVKDHLSLEKIRYEERLELSYEIDGSIEKERLPPLIVQTLVENAIKHGISKRQLGGQLHIRAKDIGEEIQIQVENCGTLESNAESTGIGLDNLRRRLAILYKEKAELTLSKVGSNKVQAQVVIPKIKNLKP